MTNLKRASFLIIAVVLAALIGGLAAVWQYRGSISSTPAPLPVAGTPPTPAASGAEAGQPASGAALPAVESPAWAKLTSAQKEALAPLAQEWGSMSKKRRDKWLAIAGRYRRLSPEGRKRLHERMTEWVNMTPQQRQTARQAYQNAKSVPPSKKAEAWEKYQHLTEAQKKKLAAEEKSRQRPSVVSAPPSGRPEVKNPYGVVHRQPASTPEGAAATPLPAPPAEAPATAPPLQPDIYSH